MKLLTRLFSCRHNDIGTPVTVDGETKVYCRDCGKTVPFDPETLMVGRAA